MTAIEHLYRLRVYEPDGVTLDWSTTSLFAEAPTISGQRVEPKEASTSSRPWTVTLVDAEQFVTEKLADSSGRAQLLRRVGDVSVSTDGGSNYTVLGTGRIDDVDMVGVSSFAVTFTDERLVERTTTIFVGENSTRIAPAGLAAAWRTYQPVLPARFLVADVDAGANRTTYSVLGGSSLGGVLTALAVDDDAIKLMEDTPELIRAEIAGTDREIYQINGYFSLSNPAGGLARMDEPRINSFTVKGYQDPGTEGTTVREVFFHMPTANPSQTLPLHLGGQAGIDPFQLAKDIYDGAYQGSGDVATVRYDADHFSAYDPSTNPQGLIGRFPRIYPHIVGPENMGAFLDREVYAPNGVVPLVNAFGEVAPVRVRTPDIVDIADPDNLFEFNAQNCSVGPSWRNQGRDQVTVVEFSFVTVRPSNPRDERPGLDGFTRITQDLTREAPNADTVRVVHAMTVGSSSSSVLTATRIAGDLFDRFADGPVYASLKGMDATKGVMQGHWVVIDFPGLYPALQNQSRTGKRIAQVLSKTSGPDGYEFELIEAGPNSQPLATPSVSVATNPDEPRHAIDVTVSGLPAGSWAILNVAVNATEPAEGSDLWQYRRVRRNDSNGLIGNETLTIGQLPSGSKVWVRAISRQIDRIDSDWSTADDADTTALSAPTSVSVGGIDGAEAVLSWTPGETDYDLLVDLDGDVQARIVAGSTEYRYSGLAPSTGYTAGVRHLDNYGGMSARVTDGFTSSATDDAVPDMAGIRILVGTES